MIVGSWDCQDGIVQVHKCRGAEGETLMGKMLYKGEGFTHIFLRGLSWKTVVSKRMIKSYLLVIRRKNNEFT